MIRRLTILLLIVGCDEPSQHGCLDSQACNYDSKATIDNNSCIYEVDCAGVCGGEDISCVGCDEIQNSGLVFDECGLCSGSGAVDGYNCDGHYLDDINFLQDLYDSSLAWYIANNSSEWFLENATSLNYFCLFQVWGNEGRLVELNCSNTMGYSQGYDLNCSIPESFGDVTKLESLIIVDSHLSGTIPESIWNLQYLEQVDLHLNCLLPPYPSCLSTEDIGNQPTCP